MQAIFLCETKENPMRVFADATIRKICASVEAEPTVYTKADVLRDKARFADTAYIFSTWGMPTFTEEEIAACFPALQAVFYAAGTVQSFARPFLRRGVKVFCAWAANAVPVAEYTVAQIILANKGFFAVCGFQSRAAHKGGAQGFFVLRREF